MSNVLTHRLHFIKYTILVLLLILKFTYSNCQTNEYVNDTILNKNKMYYKTCIYTDFRKKIKVGEVLYCNEEAISDTIHYVSNEFSCNGSIILMYDRKRGQYFYDVVTKKCVMDLYFDGIEHSYCFWRKEFNIYKYKNDFYLASICDSFKLKIDNTYAVQGVDSSIVFVNSNEGTTVYDLQNGTSHFYQNGQYYTNLDCFCIQDSCCYLYRRDHLEFDTKLNFSKVISNPYSRCWVVKKDKYFGLVDHYPYSYNENIFREMNDGTEPPHFKELVDYKYDTIYRINYPILATKKYSKFGMIYNDKEVLNPIYDTVYTYGILTVYAETINGRKKLGLVWDEEILTEAVFSEVTYLHGKYFLIKHDKKETCVYVYNPLSQSDKQLFQQSLKLIHAGIFNGNRLIKVYKMKDYINLYHMNAFFSENGYYTIDLYFINADTELFCFSESASVRNEVIKKKKGDVLKSVKQNYDLNGKHIYYNDASLGDLYEFSFEFSNRGKSYIDKYYYSKKDGFVMKPSNKSKTQR